MKIGIVLLLMFFLASAFQHSATAVIIEPGTYFKVGNANYTVNKPIDFSQIVVGGDFIMFNNLNFTTASADDYLLVTIISINEYGVGFSAIGKAWLTISGLMHPQTIYVDGGGSYEIYDYGEPSVVEVESKTVTVGQSFVLNIMCYPKEPVKGWELKVKFDRSHLSANSASEGNFFNGYVTFPVLGTINNIDGTIIDIYNLIVGQGNASSSGIIASINFTAISEGNASIEIYDVGLCNESRYLLYTVNNGSVVVLAAEPEDPPVTPLPVTKPPGGSGGSHPPEDPPEEEPPVENPHDEIISLNNLIIISFVFLMILIVYIGYRSHFN